MNLKLNKEGMRRLYIIYLALGGPPHFQFTSAATVHPKIGALSTKKTQRS